MFRSKGRKNRVTKLLRKAVNAITPTTARTGIVETLTPEYFVCMINRIMRGRFLKV